jgi:hypothetical protein
MQKPELLIKVSPSGDPLLRGYCSACPNVNFVFAVNTDENLKLMQQAFAIRLQDVHGPETDGTRSVEIENAA